jgi:hypothetical protein
LENNKSDSGYGDFYGDSGKNNISSSIGNILLLYSRTRRQAIGTSTFCTSKKSSQHCVAIFFPEYGFPGWILSAASLHTFPQIICT